MNVLIIGGCGFIGTNLIERLVKDDVKIVVLDNYTSGYKSNQIKNNKVKYFEGSSWDIIDGSFSRINFDPELVFHFGEFSRIVQSFENPNLVFHSNTFGTQQVLQYCVNKNAKLIYSGSSSIFGNDMEDQHLNPYSWTKAKNIELIKNYEQWFGLDYAIAYFYNVYGPRQITEGPYATVIGIFEKQAKEGKPLTVVKPGTQRRVFTHIEDIVEGLVLIGLHGKGDGYFLGADENVSILEVVKMFDKPFEFIPERRGERLQSTKCESRARRELGWKPKWRLMDYVSQKDFSKS